MNRSLENIYMLYIHRRYWIDPKPKFRRCFNCLLEIYNIYNFGNYVQTTATAIRVCSQHKLQFPTLQRKLNWTKRTSTPLSCNFVIFRAWQSHAACWWLQYKLPYFLVLSVFLSLLAEVRTVSFISWKKKLYSTWFKYSTTHGKQRGHSASASVILEIWIVSWWWGERSEQNKLCNIKGGRGCWWHASSLVFCLCHGKSIQDIIVNYHS